MPRSAVLNIDHAWQSVTLEERLELLQRAQANGFMASALATLVIGSVAYGLDQIWLLFFGAGMSLFFFPMFSRYTWSREKPTLILAYLAARSMSRRFAYAYNIPDINTLFIYRAQLKELFIDAEQSQKILGKDDFSLDNQSEEFKDVWVILMRGGLVVLSECVGGAKMELLTHLNQESVLRKPRDNEDVPSGALVIEGVAAAKGRTIALTSRYQAAHYVFEKRLGQVISAFKLAPLPVKRR